MLYIIIEKKPSLEKEHNILEVEPCTKINPLHLLLPHKSATRGPSFFCPHFCFSRIQSSLKCISFMTHFTLMVIKTDNFLSNVSGHLDVQGGAYVSWTDWVPTWLQAVQKFFAPSAAAGSSCKKETHLLCTSSAVSWWIMTYLDVLGPSAAVTRDFLSDHEPSPPPQEQMLWISNSFPSRRSVGAKVSNGCHLF